jgi:hypothetical protein
MIRIFIIGFLLLNINLLFAQNNAPMRIEVDENGIEEVYSLPLENKTLLILTHKEKRAPKGEHWVIDTYNSIFFKLGKQNLYLPREFTLFNYKLMNDSIVYLTFAEENGKYSSLMIYKLNVKTNILSHAYIKGYKKSRLLHIEYLKDKIFLIGNRMEGMQEQLKEVKLPNDIKVVAPVFPEYTNVIAAYTSLKANKVIVMTNIYRGDNKGLYYNEVNGTDNTLIKNQLHEADNITLIDGSLIESKGDALLFMGTFNYERGRIKDYDQLVREGTYFAKIVDGHFAFFKTNKFSEFTNVFSTLNYRDQVRAKENVKKGKQVSLNFRLLIHEEAIKQGDLYVLTAEAYYPEYHYENNFDSRGYMYQMQVFDGYRTNNCIVAAFNDQGRLLWDNYMHIDDIRSYKLHENVLAFGEQDSSIVLAYYSDGKVQSKVVKGNEVVYKKSEDRVETVLNENILTDSKGLMEHWYDNYFILSGYQTLIGRDSKKRKVYYFNMISFE